MELKESHLLASDYTTNLQSSKQYGTGTKKRHKDQCNRIKSPNKPQTCAQLIYKNRGKTIQWRKDSLFTKC